MGREMVGLAVSGGRSFHGMGDGNFAVAFDVDCMVTLDGGCAVALGQGYEGM